MNRNVTWTGKMCFLWSTISMKGLINSLTSLSWWINSKKSKLTIFWHILKSQTKNVIVPLSQKKTTKSTSILNITPLPLWSIINIFHWIWLESDGSSGKRTIRRQRRNWINSFIESLSGAKIRLISLFSCMIWNAHWVSSWKNSIKVLQRVSRLWNARLSTFRAEMTSRGSSFGRELFKQPKYTFNLRSTRKPLSSMKVVRGWSRRPLNNS